jgi:hypothetical protein
MSLNMQSEKFDLAAGNSAQRHASWAVHALNDELWFGLRGEWTRMYVARQAADAYAERCYRAAVASPHSRGSICAVIETVLA